MIYNFNAYKLYPKELTPKLFAFAFGRDACPEARTGKSVDLEGETVPEFLEERSKGKLNQIFSRVSFCFTLKNDFILIREATRKSLSFNKQTWKVNWRVLNLKISENAQKQRPAVKAVAPECRHTSQGNERGAFTNCRCLLLTLTQAVWWAWGGTREPPCQCFFKKMLHDLWQVLKDINYS